jgi:hypothetical protein
MRAPVVKRGPGGAVSELNSGGDKGAFATRIALTVAAVALAVVHVAWPRLRVDTITIVLLLVAVVPWLHKVFKSVSTPFLNFEFRELERRLDAVDGKVESSRQLVGANEARDLARREQHSPDPDTILADLAQEYNNTRISMPPGSARSDMMTGVVGRMLAAVEAGAVVDIERNLRSTNGGERLAGYAAVYARPEASMASAVVDSIIQVENTPFGAYWALQGLRRIVETKGKSVVDHETHRKLLAYAEKVTRGTDRAYEADRILRLLD